MGCQRSLQATFSSRTKTTGHRTPHLARDADRESLVRWNTHRFNGFAVVRRQQQLCCGIGCHRLMNKLQTANPEGLSLKLSPPLLWKSGDL